MLRITFGDLSPDDLKNYFVFIEAEKRGDGDKMVVKRGKRDKLDNLLLFVSSSLGLVFAVLQTVFGIAAVLFFLPLLLVGIVAPVYVGYYRGAYRGTLIHRVRGWIYLIFGLGVYVWFTISLIAINAFPISNTQDVVVFSAIFIPILVGILMASRHLVNIIFREYGYTSIRGSVSAIKVRTEGIATLFTLSLAIVALLSYLVYLFSPLTQYFKGLTESLTLFSIFISVVTILIFLNWLKAERNIKGK